MRSALTIVAAALGSLLFLQETASAQFQYQPPIRGGMGQQMPFGPMMRPTLSPYLNITGFGNPAINFYNGSNFQFNTRAVEQQILNQAMPNLVPSQPEQDELVPRLPQTGHLVGFGYYTPYFSQGGMPQRPYFPYNPMAGGAGTGGTAARTAGPPPGPVKTR